MAEALIWVLALFFNFLGGYCDCKGIYNHKVLFRPNLLHNYHRGFTSHNHLKHYASYGGHTNALLLHGSGGGYSNIGGGVYGGIHEGIHEGHSVYNEGLRHHNDHNSHVSHHHHDPNAYYEFEYGVNDPKTKDIKHQKETLHGDKIVGEYSLVEENGNVRTVKYTADWKNGFRAQVHNSKPNIH